MRLKKILWIIFLASLWGPSFLFIKIAVSDIPPFTLVAGRLILASVILFSIFRAKGGKLVFGKKWIHFAVAAFFSNALPFVLISWGETHISSALASILNGTTPVFTIVLAHLFTHDDRMTSEKLTGVLIGFVGLSLLLGPSLLGGFHATTSGSIAIVIAAASYAVAIIYTRRNLRGLPPLFAPTGQIIFGAALLIPLALIIEQPWKLPVPSLESISSLIALSVFGTALAFVVYYHLLESSSATYISMVTYLIPIFGIILGVIFLNEHLDWTAYTGCGLILISMMAINGIFKGNVVKNLINDFRQHNQYNIR